jgi:hypothetical protein
MLKREVAPLRVSFLSLLNCVIMKSFILKSVTGSLQFSGKQYFCFDKLFYCGL